MNYSSTSKVLTEKQIISLERRRHKNPLYYIEADLACTSIIPPQVRVLELGCSTGRLLAATRPSYGLGIDIDEKHIEAARLIHADKSNLEFRVDNVEEMDYSGIQPFDYIIISDVLPLSA